MANAAALIWETLPDLNWAGFYRNVGGELVVGPFQGSPACIRIKFGEGVCGVAAETRQVQRIEDVHAFPGHIACDAASNSEIVVPIVRDGELLGVLDLDSPKHARFTEEDEAGCVRASPKSSQRFFSQLNCSSRSSASEPGMIITGHGSWPASFPQKLATNGPGCRSARRPGPTRQFRLGRRHIRERFLPPHPDG